MSEFWVMMKLLGYSIGKTRKYPQKALEKLRGNAAKKPILARGSESLGSLCANCKNPIKQQDPVGFDDFFIFGE